MQFWRLAAWYGNYSWR